MIQSICDLHWRKVRVTIQKMLTWLVRPGIAHTIYNYFVVFCVQYVNSVCNFNNNFVYFCWYVTFDSCQLNNSASDTKQITVKTLHLFESICFYMFKTAIQTPSSASCLPFSQNLSWLQFMVGSLGRQLVHIDVSSCSVPLMKCLGTWYCWLNSENGSNDPNMDKCT